MYEELVKDLRALAQTFELTGRGSGRQARLPREAANAIEERCQQVDKFMEEAARLYAKQPKWIPVAERLPGREWVLCKCRAKIHEVLSLRDGYWYHDPQHQYMSGFVTHWMPLPPSPEEET